MDTAGVGCFAAGAGCYRNGRCVSDEGGLIAQTYTGPCSNSECRVPRDVGDFTSDRAHYCRDCTKDYNAAYHAANREAIAARNKARYAANQEEIAAQKKVYIAANRVTIAAYQKGYREAHREEIAAKKKDWYAENQEAIAAQKKVYRAANPEKIAARRKDYYAENQESILAQRKDYRAANPDKVAATKARRRAKKADAYHEPWTHQQVFERDGYKCQNPHCGKDVTLDIGLYADNRAIADHIHPLAGPGGSIGADAMFNLQTLCFPCNAAKSNRWPAKGHTARDGDYGPFGGAEPDAGCPDCYEDDLEAR